MEKKKSSLPLATNIRARRSEQGLSLETLAQRTGVSRAMLSDIERELKNPSIAVVCQIAEGLNCTVAELIGEEANQKVSAIQLVRRDEQQTLIDPQSGVERRILSPAMIGRGLEVVWYTIPSGQSSGVFPPHQKGVVEHITIVQGELDCYLAEQHFHLETGDTLFFAADLPHHFYNPGSEVCKYLLLIDSNQLHLSRR